MIAVKERRKNKKINGEIPLAVSSPPGTFQRVDVSDSCYGWRLLFLVCSLVESLNENYMKRMLLSLRGSPRGLFLKWGVCASGMSDLDRIRFIKGHISLPLPSRMRKKSLHTNDTWASCFALIIQWASFLPHAHPGYVNFFFF